MPIRFIDSTSSATGHEREVSDANPLPVTGIGGGGGTATSTSTLQTTGNNSLASIDTDLGAQADVAATADTGTFSLIAIMKRIMARFTSLITLQGAGLPAALDASGGVKVAIVGGGSTSGPVNGTLTNRSGAVTTGGTSQQIAAANAARKWLLLQNPSTNAESLWIQFGATAAVTDSPSVEIPVGASMTFEGTFLFTDAVQVIAATTGTKWTAKEG